MSKFTKAPWVPHNMTHEEGRPMTAEEIGEYVTNSVKMGETGRFLFISAKHDDGGNCDVCHIGNGPHGPYNANLIAAAPDMYEALRWFVCLVDDGIIKVSPHERDAFMVVLTQANAALAKADGEAS